VTPGRVLIAAGVALLIVGLVVEYTPVRLGRLPGDLSFGSGNVRFFVPLGTSLLISVVLTLLFALLQRR
jgi:hypothetical protein